MAFQEDLFMTSVFFWVSWFYIGVRFYHLSEIVGLAALALLHMILYFCRVAISSPCPWPACCCVFYRIRLAALSVCCSLAPVSIVTSLRLTLRDFLYSAWYLYIFCFVTSILLVALPGYVPTGASLH